LFQEYKGKVFRIFNLGLDLRWINHSCFNKFDCWNEIFIGFLFFHLTINKFGICSSRTRQIEYIRNPHSIISNCML
jgi:hypothetical protein